MNSNWDWGVGGHVLASCDALRVAFFRVEPAPTARAARSDAEENGRAPRGDYTTERAALNKPGRRAKSLTHRDLRPNFLGCSGQVAEWLKAPVSKTGIPVNPVSRVRISPCPFPSGAPAGESCSRWRVTRVPRDGWTFRRGGVRLSFCALGWVAEWFKAHAWKVCVR